MKHPALRPPVQCGHARLCQTVIQRLGAAATLRSSHLNGWASASFIGARHRIILDLVAPDAEQRAGDTAAALPEWEWVIAGHLVADCAASVTTCGDGRASLTIDVLTVEDH